MDVDKSLLMEPAQIQILIDTLLESSQHCPLNILDLEPHPSDQTLVMFAQLVYTKKKSRESDEAYGTRILSGEPILDGWKLLTTAKNTDLSNGYFGAAFAHTDSQQVVVAHRGTDPVCPGAVYTDIKGIFLTRYTSCMNSATTFVDHIRQVIRSVNGRHSRHYTLAITGHSLGGWLAQMTTFSVKYLAIGQGCLEKNPEVGIHAKTVGFDSPGARDMLDRVLDDYYNRCAMDVFLDGLDITLYLSAPNHINTCGVHLGKIYRIFNDVSNFNLINKHTILYTLATHAMSNFVKALVIDKNGVIGEVTDWAKNMKELKKLFKVLKWDNNYHGHAKDDASGSLAKKLHRYKVAVLESPENVEIFKSSFRVFAEDEMLMLYKVHMLQEQKSEGSILNEFVKKKNLKVEGSKLFPDFDIDHYNQTITCKSGESLAELRRRLKQLLRWLKLQFTQAIHSQIKVFPHAADLMFYAEGQSYLDSVPMWSLDFADSVGFQDFLVSGSERVLSIVTGSGGGAFQMARLRNILHQIKRSVNSSDRSIKYITESHYTFLGWPQLKELIQIYGRPIDQEYLIVVDSTSSSITKENRTTLIDYLQVLSNSMKLVLITSHLIDTPDTSAYIKIVRSDCNINFTDLTQDSQNIMLARDNAINVDDKGYSFRQFLGDNCSIQEVNRILSSECLNKFATIKNYAINIKDTRPTLGDLQMPFFKLNIKICKEFILKCVDSSDNNILVVMSGLRREELETGAGWEQFARKEIILAEGDTELFFKNTCNENQDKTIYLCFVSGEDVYCKQIFDEGFYLPRKFLHRACINVRKFAVTKHNDLFVVCSKEDMVLLSERGEFLRNVEIATTKEEEDDIIQKSFNNNIHFVKIHHGGKKYEVEWRYSHGSVENLRPYVSTKFCEPIDEVSLSKTERNLVIITDEPGMGKTTTLSRLSRLVKSHWVIYVKLKQFQKNIARIPEVLTTQSVAVLLSKCCSQADGSLPHGLLKHLLQSKTQSKQLMLMFDGFDELDDYVKDKESAKGKIIRLLSFLKNKPTVQIFLTVRKYLKESLEEKLCLFSTCFNEVNRGEQLTFLEKFWQSCLFLELGVLGEEEKGRIRVFAMKLLQEAKRVLGPDMDCFMGVPLQLRMLAEVFRPQPEILFQTPELFIDQFDIVSAPKLYKRFIKLKLEIYFHDKTSLGTKLHKDLEEEILDDISTKHGELGFRTFFSEFFNNNLISNISGEWLNEMNRHGLIESKRIGEFQFVHRTYAEYFCAQTVVHWLNQRETCYRYPLVQEILLPLILLHPDNRIIRLFMNDILQETDMVEAVLRENAAHISGLWLQDSAIFKNKKSETALHVAVRERNEHIITFLLCRLNTVALDAREAFISFIAHYDLNYHTVLNVVDGFLSNQYIHKGIVKGRIKVENNSYYISDSGETTWNKAVDRAVFDRMLKIIFSSIEACSFELKEKVVLASLLNRDLTKSQIPKYLQRSGDIHCDAEKLLERATKILCEESSRFFRVIRKSNLVQINDLCDRLNPTERYFIFLVKDVVPATQDYPTALHWAAHCGRLQVVQLLREKSLVPFEVLMGEVDNQLRAPLQIAAGRGSLDIVQYFVERGANVNARDHKGTTALISAAEGGHLDTLQYLIAHKADVSMLNHFGHFALLPAAITGQLPLVEYLVENGADINFVDNIGQSALQVAAMKGHLPVVQYLVQHGAVIDYLNKIDMSALQMAAQLGHLPVVQYLADCGAEINYINTVDPAQATQSDQNFRSDHRTNARYTALQLAARGGHLPVVEYLVQHGALIDSVNALGRTALYRAAQEGHLLTVEYLQQNGADVNIVDGRGISVLHKAAEEGHLSIVQYLVQHNAHVNAVDIDGVSVLHIAVQEGQHLIVECLVQHGADINSVDNDGLSALYKAAQEDHFLMVEYLIRNGADINSGYNSSTTVLQLAEVERRADIKFIDEDGLPALHRAAFRGHLPTVELLITRHGVDIESRDATGQSALHKASGEGYMSVTRFLVQKGADVDCCGLPEAGGTVLQLATMEGNFPVVEFLLEQGADPNKRSQTGETALSVAAEWEGWRIMRLLVEKGADVNAQGGIALSRAIQFAEWDTVEYLIDKGALVSEDNVSENLSRFKQLYPDFEFNPPVSELATNNSSANQ